MPTMEGPTVESLPEKSFAKVLHWKTGVKRDLLS